MCDPTFIIYIDIINYRFDNTLYINCSIFMYHSFYYYYFSLSFSSSLAYHISLFTLFPSLDCLSLINQTTTIPTNITITIKHTTITTTSQNPSPSPPLSKLITIKSNTLFSIYIYTHTHIYISSSIN